MSLPGRSIPGLGQGGNHGLTVNGSHPAGHSLHPNAAVNAAHIGHIHTGSGSDALDGGAFQHGLLHLGEASGGLTEHEHDLGDALGGGQPQRRGGRGQGVVLAGAC